MINLYNCDNMEFMVKVPDKYYDLAIVDPPYGINMAMGHKGSEKRGDKNKYKNFAGNDNTIPNKEYFDELFRISKNQIVWGANYMTEYLPPIASWIVWDKKQPEVFSMAMGELAWSSFGTPLKIFEKRVVGADDVRVHPTQKPVQLYKWLLKNYATCSSCEGKGWIWLTKGKQTDCPKCKGHKPKILDTHGGSMSIAIACHDLGFDLDLCELDKDYFDAGVKRFEQHKLQLKLL